MRWRLFIIVAHDHSTSNKALLTTNAGFSEGRSRQCSAINLPRKLVLAMFRVIVADQAHRLREAG